MDMLFTDADVAFQDDVRTFLTEIPPRLIEATRRTPSVFDDYDVEMEWHSLLHNKGWLAYRWPEAYGGTGWTPVQCYIFDTECARANAPSVSPMGMKLLGPVVYTYGTPEQKQYFLPKLLAGEHYWCQGFSEPGSGSDLVSLKTRADLNGDHYLVNGTKIWTSSAHRANWIFCLVKTDTEVKAQRGISFLLIDMKSPGIEIKPIITLAGDHEVNQVFLDNVKVPAENLVGAQGQGWDIAKFLLANERGGSYFAPGLVSNLETLRQQAQQEDDGIGGKMIDDPDVALQFSKLDVEVKALEVTELRILDQVSKGQVLGPKSSIVKLIGANLRQKIDELRLQVFGYNAMELQAVRPLYGVQSPEPVSTPDAQLAMPGYLNNRAWTIFGGSDEVQKTILAKSVLGL